MDKNELRENQKIYLNTSDSLPNKTKEDDNNVNKTLLRKITFKSGTEGENDLKSINTKRIILTSRSRNMIILRVLILFFLCIYIPIEIIFGPYFNQMEDKMIFENISIDLPKILKSPLVIFITDAVIYMIGDKDMIMLYSTVFYMVFHPFIAVKLIFVTHFTHFFFVLMRCLYQAYRPIWLMKVPLTQFCLTSHSHPSMHYFFVTFFYLYLIISIRLVNKRRGKLSLKRKIITMTIFLLGIILFGLLMLVKAFNYLYQLVFAFTFSLLVIVISLDLETVIHNYIFNSLKNIFKIRKNKIKLFLIILAMNIISILIYNFIETDTIDLLTNNQILNHHCSQAELTNIGLKSTFNDITYIYGILGAFFGTSLTVEKSCGEWWHSSWKNSLLKVFITFVFGSAFLLMFSFYNSTSFEFNYVVYALKYIVFYYLIMGWLPILFEVLGLNRKVRRASKKKSLFTQSLFSFNIDKKNNQEDITTNTNNKTNSNNKRKNNNQLPDYIKNKELYSRSIIVGGMEAKHTMENLEFLIGKNTLTDAGDLENNNNESLN